MTTLFKPGDLVWVARAAQIREHPAHRVEWYRAKVLRVEPRETLTIYRCWIELHANESRPVYVRNTTHDIPSLEWDAIKARPQ